MTITDETLMRFVDGELEPDEQGTVERAIAADAGARARVASMRAQREQLRAAFAPMLEEPVPERLLAVLASRPAANVLDLGGRRRAPALGARIRAWSWPEWSAIAASVAVGLLVAQLAPRESMDGLVRNGGGGLVAGRTLATALSSQLASSQADDAAVRVGLSFENGDRALCRTFHADRAGGVSGLACFVDGEWRLGMLLKDPAGATPHEAGGMRQAASAVPPALLQAVTEQMRGEPFDAQAERAALEHGWRR